VGWVASWCVRECEWCDDRRPGLFFFLYFYSLNSDVSIHEPNVTLLTELVTAFTYIIYIYKMEDVLEQSHGDFALSECSYRDMSVSIVGGTRRDTFRFDELLYDDVNIAVTPSVLIVRRTRRCLCWVRRYEKEYLIQDIGKVEVGEHAPKQHRFRKNNINSNTKLANINLEVRKHANVLLFAQYPEAAAIAIENAKKIFY